MQATFRLDIQILRGIAVLLVLFNHFFSDSFPNGFIGVDIFFVISGYVIASSTITRSSSTTSFSRVDFYLRRIIRLYPALLTVTTLVIVPLIFFTLTSGAATRAAIASIVGLSNIYFLFISFDYYGATSLLNPFLHTWSLAVEQQFYLFFPFFFFFFWKLKLFRLLLITLILALLSYFIGLVNFNFFFYSPVTRVWEFLSGIYILKFIQQSNFYPGRIFQLFSIILLFFLSSFGPPLPLIAPFVSVFIATFYLISIGLPLPPWLHSFSIVSKVVAFFGLISYSLYLWHWPLLSLFTILFGSSVAIKLLSLLLSVLLSIFTYHFLEYTLTSKILSIYSRINIARIFASISFGLCILLPLLSLKAKGILFSKESSNLIANNLPGYQDFPQCSDNTLTAIKTSCILNKSATQTNIIYLLGDSHALHLAPVFQGSSKILNRPVYISTQSGIPFPPILFSRTPHHPRPSEISLYRNQLSNFDYILSYLRPGDIILISNYTQRYFGSRSSLNATLNFTPLHSESFARFPVSKAYTLWLSSLYALVAKATNLGAKVVFILPTIEMNNSFTLPGQCIPSKFLLSASNSPPGCSYPRQLFSSSFLAISADLSRLAFTFPAFTIYDPLDYFCDLKCTIYDYSTRKLLLYDVDHLSQSGALKLRPSLLKFLLSLK